MASLSDFNVVEKANEGSALELVAPADKYDKDGDIIFFKGDKLTDKDEKSADPKNVKVLYIKLLGADSDKYRKLTSIDYDRRLNKKNKKIDTLALMDENATRFARCTTECYLFDQGKLIECNFSTMYGIYKNVPWVYEQVEAHLDDRSNLFKS